MGLQDHQHSVRSPTGSQYLIRGNVIDSCPNHVQRGDVATKRRIASRTDDECCWRNSGGGGWSEKKNAASESENFLIEERGRVDYAHKQIGKGREKARIRAHTAQ